MLWSIWLGAGGCTSAHHPNGKTALNYQQRLQLGLKTDKIKQIGEKSPSPWLQLIIQGRNSWLQDVAVPRGSCGSMKGLVMLNTTVAHTLSIQEGLCCWWGSPGLSLKAHPLPSRDGYGQKQPKHDAITPHRHCFIVYGGLSSSGVSGQLWSFLWIIYPAPHAANQNKSIQLLLPF